MDCMGSRSENFSSVFQMCILHAMYQELLPFGIDPLDTYEKNNMFLDDLEYDQTTLSPDFKFNQVVNKPIKAPTGTIFVSFHFSRHFSCIPIALLRDLFPGSSLMFIMDKSVRDSLPKWKEAVYRYAEQELGLQVCYAEDKSTLLRVAKHLKKGGNAFTFLDVKFGSTEKVNTLPVDFISHKIFIPSSLFQLAAKINCSISPILATGTNDQAGITFGPTQKPSISSDLAANNKPKKTNIDESVQKVISFFANALLTKPYEWSQWEYLYNYTDQEQYININSPPRAGEEFIEYDGDKFVFNFEKGFLDSVES